MGVISGPNIITDGLVFLIDSGVSRSYNGTSIWKDKSGNNHNATITGSPVLSNDGLVFSGSEYIEFLNPLGSGSQEWTVAAFLKVLPGDNQTLLGINKGLKLFHGTSGKMLNYANSSYYEYSVAGASTWLSDGEWKYVEFKLKEATNYFYMGVNTISKGAGTGHTNPAIGISSTIRGFSSFKGTVGNVLIYNRVITADESVQNYNEFKHRFKS
jgi:hypothetical protein